MSSNRKATRSNREHETIAFIATKPLQILIATAIKSQMSPEKNFVLAVVDGFSSSKIVADNISESELGWKSVIWAKSKEKLLPAIKDVAPDKVFVDSDVGIRNLIYLIKLKLRTNLTSMFVYEEGVGTYRSDLYLGVKRMVLQALGVGVNFGGSAIVDGIYLYDPKNYAALSGKISKSIIPIEKNVASIVATDPLIWANLFEAGFFVDSLKSKSTVCHIYMSSWNVDERAIAFVSSKSGDKYMKLHPHLKSSDFRDLDEGVRVVPSQMPAELVLGLLASIYEKVFVYHHGSSVIRYVNEADVIIFYLLRRL